MNKLKKIINIIGKQNVILIMFIFIVLVTTSLYQTFSLFTSSEGVSFIDGLKTYKFILNANNDTNTITIAANSSKKVAVTVSNEEALSLLYGIYYSSSNDLSLVNMGYLNNNKHLPNGTINSNSKYVIRFGIDNLSSDDITITFGIKYGLSSGGDLILDSEQNWFNPLYSYLNDVATAGSYVAYTGNNGCIGSACRGQNANYVDNTNMGYCGGMNDEFTVNGWRIAYADDDSTYLISAGAPECICTNSDGSALEDNCSSYDITGDSSLHLSNLNNAALKYCNIDYAYGGICDNTSAWAMNTTDFEKVAVSDINTCIKKYSLDESCGYNNDLLDNGGNYWIAASATYTPNWIGSEHYIDNTIYSNAPIGFRPVLKIDPLIVVTDGSGTYEDPYIISTITRSKLAFNVNENFDNETYESNIIITNGNDGWNSYNGIFSSTNAHKDVSYSSSTIEFTPTLDAILSFDYGVSSEKDNDYLTITLTGSDSSSITLIDNISGEKEGSITDISLTSGVTYTLTCSYTKNETINEGDDIGWIDNLVIQS